MDDAKKKALIELLENSRQKVGTIYNKENYHIAQLKAEKGGTLEKLEFRIVELEERLASTSNELYAVISWSKSILEDK